MKVKSLSSVRLLATSWTAAYQAPLSMGFSRQESIGFYKYIVQYIYHNIIQNSFTALKHPLCLEKEMPTPSRILAWEIPGTEELVKLQSIGSQGLGHNLVPDHSHF